MQRYVRSLRFALEGLIHALVEERNFKVFFALYILSLMLGAFFLTDGLSWMIVIFSGGIFLSVELMNTALERFTDAFDVHSRKQSDDYRDAVKLTKDIAAAASLVAFISWISILVLVFLQAQFLFAMP